MKKYVFLLSILLSTVFLGGCAGVGERSSSVSVVYLMVALLSVALFVGCALQLKKSEPWMLLLFASVLVINWGYFALSVSKTLSAALWANRVSYLGSTLLPLAMLMIILKVSDAKKPTWLPYILFFLAGSVFFLAASPGILDIYYKEVHLGSYNGATILIKEYGPWHLANYIYLLGYTLITAVIAVRTALRKKLSSSVQVFVLVTAVFINIGVWLLEQLVNMDFELLSVSYIFSELLLLCLFIMIRETEKQSEGPLVPADAEEKSEELSQSNEQELLDIFKKGVSSLTPTESVIYGHYLDGKGTKDIMALLGITENTLKYHNKNIYSKLGVSSRKQLIERSKLL